MTIFLCDYTPVDYQQYFDELLSTVSPKGLVICSQYSPVIGLLKGGKYNAIRRPFKQGRREVFEYLNKAVKRHAMEAIPA